MDQGSQVNSWFSASFVFLISSAAIILSSFVWAPSLIKRPSSKKSQKKKKSKKPKKDGDQDAVDTAKQGNIDSEVVSGSLKEPKISLSSSSSSIEVDNDSTNTSMSNVHSNKTKKNTAINKSKIAPPSLPGQFTSPLASSTVTSNSLKKKKNPKKKLGSQDSSSHTPFTKSESAKKSDVSLTTNSGSQTNSGGTRSTPAADIDRASSATSLKEMIESSESQDDGNSSEEPETKRMATNSSTSSSSRVIRLDETANVTLDDGWEVVTVSKGKKKSKSSASLSTAPEKLTKKQRENQKKAERLKAEKQALDDLQEKRLAQYRREQESARLAVLATQEKQKERARQFARNFTPGNVLPVSAPSDASSKTNSWYADGKQGAHQESSSIWD